MIYLQDKYDDMMIGVKSTALKFGDQTKPWLFSFTGLMCAGLTSVGVMGDLTWPYYLAVALTCGRLTHQVNSLSTNYSKPSLSRQHWDNSKTGDLAKLELLKQIIGRLL